MKYYIIGLLTLLCLKGSSQSSWKFDHITTDNGLSTGTVNCVFKDSKGYIWIGTLDGLNRYDGYSITVYKNKKNDTTSITGNIITAIAEGQNGDIWIGTRSSGINIFDWKTETFSQLSKNNQAKIPGGAIKNIVLTEDGRLLFGSLEGGLCIYDYRDNSLTNFTASMGKGKGPTSDMIFSIIKASPHEYWISNHSGIIDLFNIKSLTFQHFTHDANYNIAKASRKPLYEDADGFLWIGTDGYGLIKFHPETNEQKIYTKENSGLLSNIITTLYGSAQHLIYIGTNGDGINILNPETDQFNYLKASLLDQQSLTSDAVYQIFEDDLGVIWVSTFRGGVNTYSPYRSKFKLYKQIPFEDNSLSFSSVLDVLETSDGYIWIGTDGGGLDRLDRRTGEFEHFTHDPNDPASISTNTATSLLEDSQGYLWVGTYAGGVNRLDRKTGKFRRFLPDPNDRNTINSSNVWTIFENPAGIIWFGLLNGGLDKYDPITDRFTHFEADGQRGSLSKNEIITVLKDSKNNFWIGTEGAGLDLFNESTKTFTNFRHSDGDSTTILHNNIRTLFEDSKGQLWIGTEKGANIMNTNDQSIIKAPVNELLPGLVINGILEDSQGNLWIASNKGLSKYNPTEHIIKNFTKSDGLQGNEFNYTSSIKTRDGTMYFGGVKGLNSFKPSEVKMSTFEPNVVIADIKLFDQSISNLVKKNGEKLLTTSPLMVEELTLKYNQNVLEITFASLDFTSPQSNNYRYKLEGFDQNWVYTDASKRSANYTNLDPDVYTFYLEGTNSDDIWSSKSRMLTIKVLPPWWETWWFKTLVFFLIIAGAFVFIRSRTIRHTMQKEVLNQKIAEATNKVYAQNKELIIEQNNLSEAIEETNNVINKAVVSGDFSARISLENKTGEWRRLSESINTLFDSIVLPFSRINDVINALAKSDLRQKYEYEAKGDIKRVTDNLNQAIDRLAELLLTVKDNTTAIGQASDEMQLSSQEMMVGTGEIASSTSELSNGAQEQVRRIDEASSTLENILKFSSNMGDQAQSINQAAEKGVKISEGGQVQMNQMDHSMKKMQQVSTKTNVSIGALKEKSNKISGILNSIKEISVETNMLALNAAIEAAKAGDAGRGFAVVADQIRKLAENASNFAKEIENIISEVQGSIISTEKLMDEMNEDIQGSVAASNNASQSFTQLASSYSQTLNLSEQIVSYTDQQLAKVKEVVQLMESVVVIAEEAAVGTEEIASSSNQLSAGMTVYTDKTKKVSSIIESLKEKMDQFKLIKE
ncbi:MAG: two-component regulator propeller domain-containing protein [Bacteroidota bacterium]